MQRRRGPAGRTKRQKAKTLEENRDGCEVRRMVFSAVRSEKSAAYGAREEGGRRARQDRAGEVGPRKTAWTSAGWNRIEESPVWGSARDRRRAVRAATCNSEVKANTCH